MLHNCFLPEETMPFLKGSPTQKHTEHISSIFPPNYSWSLSRFEPNILLNNELKVTKKQLNTKAGPQLNVNCSAGHLGIEFFSLFK